MSGMDDQRVEFMIKIREYRQTFVQGLLPVYDAMEAENFFHLALEHFRGLKRTDIALHPDLYFDQDELVYWNHLRSDLLAEKPIQYLLGKTHFYGMEFRVNTNVLIPRPETEELVEWIIGENINTENLSVLDIGTGSGCIAIALAKHLTNAKVSAIDVVEGALAIAAENAAHNQVDVNFIIKNILECDDLEHNYDIIVSNPPYVRELEKHEIRKNVLDNEPHLALFVEDSDPLLFYRKISSLAMMSLRPGAKLYFEINQYLGAETVNLLEIAGFSDIELKQDIYGNERMIRAIR
jgi:release factor glutamine methyltransferase